MLKTLAILVGSMMATSGFLAWMDPSNPLASPTPSVDDLLPAVRLLVGDDVTIAPHRWRGMELLAGRSRASTLLAAQPASQQHHFHIDAAGLISRTTGWTRQQYVGRSANVVSVRIVPSATDRRMSRAQWNGIHALLLALEEAGAPNLEVSLDVEWKRTYGLEPGSVIDFGPRLQSGHTLSLDHRPTAHTSKT